MVVAPPRLAGSSILFADWRRFGGKLAGQLQAISLPVAPPTADSLLFIALSPWKPSFTSLMAVVISVSLSQDRIVLEK